jgi:hypothetical protein
MMAADDDLPWTTSRCNRLLRPLSSKLTKLRAEVERPRSAGAEVRSFSTAFATKCSPQKTTNFTRPANKPRGFEKARDPDWRPGAKAGAGKKTYGGRGARKLAGIQREGSDTGHVARPGEIAFTPLVARMGGPLQSSPQVQASPLKKYGKNRGPLQVNIDWTQMPGDVRKLVQGISEAYANVLQATADCDGKSWMGTRSLMGACLRRLPAYIELEAHFAKLDKDADDEDAERDVAAEIYEHLETQFEQRVGQGWRPFRQVVRAHATSLLCDAVADEVISLESMTVLVTHCVRVSAWDEAEQLLNAHIPLLQSLGMPLSTKADLFDGQKSPYLRAVKDFVDHTGRRQLLFSLLEHMIAFELLPLEWLATEQLRPVWDRLVRSISSSDPRTVAEASRFFQTVTMAGMGLPDERLLADATDSIRRFVPSSRDELRQALDTTYLSLITVLCSIALVNNSREDEAGRQITRQVISALDSVVIAIFKRDDIKDEIRLLEADEEDLQVFAQRAMSMLFASFLVHLDDCCVKDFTASLDLANLIGGFRKMISEYPLTTFSTSSIFGSLPTLVSSVARGTGRIWKDDGFEQLQRLVQGLISLSGQHLPHKLWTFKRLALESATTFAQETNTSEHMIYARDIERKMRIQGRLVISPVKTDSPSSSGGFRWEEGIGEWVACTPFAGKQAVKRLARRPPPVFELLPTPAQSEDDHPLPEDAAEQNLDNGVEELSESLYDDEEAAALQSSPIKRQSRTSTSSLGKRHRASSPVVLVTNKRSCLTPPDTPVEYYPLLPEEKEAEDGPRRSRRSTKDIKALASRLRIQRTRTTSGSGLREQRRKSYADQDEVEEDSDNTDASSDNEESTAASSDSDHESKVRPQRRSIPSRTWQNAQYDGACDDEDEDDRDDLGITPARPQRTTTKALRVQPALRKQTRPVRSQWWKVRGAVVGDSEDDGSEDELSFH